MFRSRNPLLLAAASVAVLVLAGQGAHAQSAPPKKKGSDAPQDQPAVVTADQLVYDRDLGLVTARGHVEIDQGRRILLADTVSYNAKQDVMIATGRVSLTETTGEIVYADYIEMTGDMKEAIAKGIRVLMVDDSRLAANYARRTEGSLTVLDKAIYTACRPCAEDPTRPPVWAIKGDRVIHDADSHLIEYENAWLELGGIPIAYTPYLSHADPSIKRLSGWLPPSVITNKILGTGVRTPYFQVIDENQDVTLSPLFTSKDDIGLSLVHRYKDYDGEAKAVLSVTNLEAPNYSGHSVVGWHLDAKSLFDIDENWRAGYQLQRTSDHNYLPSIGIHPLQPYLTMNPFLENFTYSNYFSVQAYSFQSLTSLSQPAGAPETVKEPVVFPQITYSFVSDPDAWGGYATFDTHAAAINRLHGTSDRQINTQTAWHLPVTLDDGQLIKVSGALRADVYNTNDLSVSIPGTENTYRVVPSVAVDWRYPFTRIGEHITQTITPIVMAAYSPFTANESKIPNNDSLDFELDDMNIFSPTPSSGYDRLVTGPRVAYGVQYTIANRGQESADILLGQSYELHPQTVLPRGTGLDNTLSDIVGRADLSPSSNVVLSYRFRLDRESYDLRRSEASMSLGPRALNLNLGYVFYDQLADTSPFTAREQMSATLSGQISRNWSGQVYTIQNLGPSISDKTNGPTVGPLQSGVRLTYEDECFLLTADAGTRHTTSAVFAQGHYFTLSIVFKTLGQIPVDLF